ncbi:MAG: hypothetical protein ACR2JJ_00515 [Sphingomicrobium sp.]
MTEPEQTVDPGTAGDETQERAREALDSHDGLRSRPAERGPRKTEDTSAGCETMANDDRARGSAIGNDRMKAVFERSADVWDARATMLKRLEAQRERQDNG